MRRRLLFSTATIMCCGFSSLVSAQVSFTASPALAPPLMLAQNSSLDQTATKLDDPSNARRSPFDLFPEDSANSASDNPVDLNLNGSSDNSTEPSNAASVGQYRSSASPADTIIAGSHAISNNYFAPMEWPGARASAPNYTANYMLIQWCSDGLWDNYPAERASQCAQQAKRIAGRHHCGRCSSAGSCGQADVCQQSPTCDQAGHCGNLGQATQIRQAQVFGQGGHVGFTQCEQTSQQQQNNYDYAQANTQGSVAPQTQYAQSLASPNGRPVAVNLPPPQDSTDPGRVAIYPFVLSR